MKNAKIFLASVALACLVLSTSACASELANQVEVDDFRIFATSWVNKLNRNHIKGINHMEIALQPDGSYLARYHDIAPSSIKCIVKKTSSQKKGRIGLLKYIESIYESTGETPQKARSNDFKIVKNIRITEIFSNSGKGWR